MIKFFKKIRLKLIENNRLSKYFAYALGEVILVMIGILLALYFSNMQENKEDKQKVTWYFEELNEDIRYQGVVFDNIIESYETIISTGKSILIDFQTLDNLAKVDSLNYKLNSLMVSEIYPVVNNTFTEMMSTGQLSLIKDKQLVTKIINYYLKDEDYQNAFEGDINNVFYKDIHPVLNEVTQVELADLEPKYYDERLLKLNDSFTKHIEEKLQNPETALKVINAIKLYVIIADSHIDIINEMKEFGEIIRDDILKAYEEIHPE